MILVSRPGVVPIMLFGIKTSLKNWDKINGKLNANSLLLAIQQMTKDHGLKRYLGSIGIGPESDMDNIKLHLRN